MPNINKIGKDDLDNVNHEEVEETLAIFSIGGGHSRRNTIDSLFLLPTETEEVATPLVMDCH